MTRPLAAVLLVFLCSAVVPAPAQLADSFVIEGDTTFTTRQFLAGLRRFDISLLPPIEPTTADDAAFFLREFLFNRGFPDAEVTYDFQTGNRRVVFEVSEGPRFQLGIISFTGAQAISSDRMREILIAEVRQVTLSPFGRPRYVQIAVESGLERIRLALVHDGYLDARLSFEPTFQNRTVDLAVTVEEGPLYYLTSVRIEGGEVPQAVRDIALSYQGRAYRPGLEVLARSQALDALRNHGYFDAAVNDDIFVDNAAAQASIVLTIKTGSQYTLGTIGVSGQRQTRLNAILRRLGLKSGVPYNAASVDEAIRRLWFSGAFADIRTKQTPTPEKAINLSLDVDESRAKQLSGTIGYGQWIQAFGEINYIDRNFLGTLNRFALNGELSVKGYGIGATLSNPYFLGTDTTASLGAFYLRQELPAYEATQIGTFVGFEQKVGENEQTGWRVGYEWKAVLNSTVFADTALDGADLNYTLGNLTFGQTSDRRNDVLSPMKGWLLKWDGDLASRVLLGNLSFGRLTAQATWYQPLRKITPEAPFVPFIILNHRAGLIAPFGDTSEIPVQERFFLGGPDTVRSFQIDGMAPRNSDGIPEGGLAYLVANAELQWPIWKALYVATFVDVGNLASTLQDFSWDETRIGPGLGARLYTPLGALRVDYGYNLVRKDGDPVGAWQFGFGFTF